MAQVPNHLLNKWQTAKRGGGIAALLRFGYIYIYIYTYVYMYTYMLYYIQDTGPVKNFSPVTGKYFVVVSPGSFGILGGLGWL